MADRIVQLEDNEGNKVYPISAFDESAVLIDTTSPESAPFDISTMGSYSLEEIETPFTWIDGKKIYKKTVDFGSLPNNTVKWVDTNVSADQFIKIEGLLSIQNGTFTNFLPYPGTLQEYTIELSIQGNRVRISTVRAWETPNQVYVTVYYTKS